MSAVPRPDLPTLFRRLTDPRLASLEQRFPSMARIAWELLDLHDVRAPQSLERAVRALGADVAALDFSAPRRGWLTEGPAPASSLTVTSIAHVRSYGAELQDETKKVVSLFGAKLAAIRRLAGELELTTAALDAKLGPASRDLQHIHAELEERRAKAQGETAADALRSLRERADRIHAGLRPLQDLSLAAHEARKRVLRMTRLRAETMASIPRDVLPAYAELLDAMRALDQTSRFFTHPERLRRTEKAREQLAGALARTSRELAQLRQSAHQAKAALECVLGWRAERHASSPAPETHSSCMP